MSSLKRRPPPSADEPDATRLAMLMELADRLMRMAGRRGPPLRDDDDEEAAAQGEIARVAKQALEAGVEPEKVRDLAGRVAEWEHRRRVMFDVARVVVALLTAVCTLLAVLHFL